MSDGPVTVTRHRPDHVRADSRPGTDDRPLVDGRSRGDDRSGTDDGSGTGIADGALRPADRRSIAAELRANDRGQPPATDQRLAADDGDGAFVRALAAEAARKLEHREASRVLHWAASVVPRFAVTSSFGAESVVLLHMLSTVAPHVPVLFLDTGLHFEQTLAHRRELARELGLRVVDVHPARTVAEQAADVGDALWYRDPDRCCGLRKTAPLRQALADVDGWATGVRRSQTPQRAGTPVVEARRHAGRWLVKVAPLAPWRDEDVAAYVRRRDLPVNPLVADGYRSIGCAPCTTRTAADDDPRAGRWAHDPTKTECGLHLADDGRLVRSTTTPG